MRVWVVKVLGERGEDPLVVADSGYVLTLELNLNRLIRTNVDCACCPPSPALPLTMSNASTLPYEGTSYMTSPGIL